jgi:hypothetical protein
MELTTLIALESLVHTILVLIEQEKKILVNVQGRLIQTDNFSVNYGKIQLVCFYCRKKGHVRDTCRKLLRACYECGANNHFVKDCPLKAPRKPRYKSDSSQSFKLDASSPNLVETRNCTEALRSCAEAVGKVVGCVRDVSGNPGCGKNLSLSVVPDSGEVTVVGDVNHTDQSGNSKNDGFRVSSTPANLPLLAETCIPLTNDNVSPKASATIPDTKEKYIDSDLEPVNVVSAESPSPSNVPIVPETVSLPAHLNTSASGSTTSPCHAHTSEKPVQPPAFSLSPRIVSKYPQFSSVSPHGNNSLFAADIDCSDECYVKIKGRRVQAMLAREKLSEYADRLEGEFKPWFPNPLSHGDLLIDTFMSSMSGNKKKIKKIRKGVRGRWYPWTDFKFELEKYEHGVW